MWALFFNRHLLAPCNRLVIVTPCKENHIIWFLQMEKPRHRESDHLTRVNNQGVTQLRFKYIWFSTAVHLALHSVQPQEVQTQSGVCIKKAEMETEIFQLLSKKRSLAESRELLHPLLK